MRAGRTFWVVLCGPMLGPVVGCGSNADLPIDPPAPPPACDVGELAIHGCEQRCPAGEIELDGVCQPAGVVEGQCAEGFVYDGDHGCEPVGAPICGPGTLAVPGEEACHPVVACTGTWGAAPLAANTVYVQAGAIGGGGSQAMPFASVQQGIDAATNGAVIAIAAGSYAEDVAIGKAVQLWGACPEQTTIVGTGTEIAAVYVQSGAAGAQLHDLGVSGAGIGVLVAGAIDVVIDQLWIHDTARRGIDAETVFGTTSVSVTRSLVENAGEVGIFSLGASTFIEASVVRGTQTSMDAARGVNVQVDPQSGVPATVTLKRSVVESNEDVGVRVWGGQLEIDGSIIRDIRPVTDIGGRGIDAYTDPLGKAAMWIHGALIDGVYDAGITGSGAEATVFATVVRNVSPEPLTGAYGRPISFDVDPVTGGRSLVAVQHSLLEKSIGGVQLAGSDGVLEGVLIRDASSATEQGRGVTIQGGAGGLHPQSTISMRGSVIEATKEVAFVSIGGLAELDSVRISDTEGMGVSAQSDVMRGRVTMFNSLVERAVGVGAGAYGADIAVHECAVRDVSVDVTGMLGRGLTAQYSIVTFQRATIDVQSTLVERTLEGGIIVLGADGLVANSIFRDSVGLAGGRLGDGVMVSSLVPLTPTSPVQPETASIGLEGCRIQNSARAGVSTFGGQVSLKGNRITCQAFDLDRENLVDLVGEMLDQGGNQCGCPDADSDCKLVSVNLEAPAPLDE